MIKGLPSLGIDAGSISLETCILDSNNNILASSIVLVKGNSLEALILSIRQLLKNCPIKDIGSVCATGSGRELIKNTIDCLTVDEITAHAVGTSTIIPEGKMASILEIGGQDSKFIQVLKKNGTAQVLDHSLNTLCAAGTGSFFDGLAKHLGLSTEELASVAQKAKTPAHVAGRCAVFSRSDIVSLYQKGVTIEEIAFGICHAAARNVISTVVRNRKVYDPFYFTGGVAANQAMARALREIMGLRDELPIVPSNYRILGAVGAAIYGRENVNKKTTSLNMLLQRIEENISFENKSTGESKPLLVNDIKKYDNYDNNESYSCFHVFENKSKTPEIHGNINIGLDIGSTSIKWAIIDDRGNIIDCYYELVSGNPAGGLRNALNRIKSSHALSILNDAEVGFCITGSGRKFACALLDIPYAVNEVTAMVRAVETFQPYTDTIFEIGGQDAKFVRLINGKVTDFSLNIACSAGTGSLLIDESLRLGLDISQLDNLALRCPDPVPIHSRCSVFMDSDIVFNIQRGKSLENIAGGIVKAVARNYLEKVADRKKIGSSVVLLGGVSRMKSMMRFFEEMIHKKINSPWWGYISGAVGAAVYAKKLVMEKPERKIKINNIEVPNIESERSSFICNACPCNCNVIKIKVTGREKDKSKYLFTGDGCGKYESLNFSFYKTNNETLRKNNLIDLKIEEEKSEIQKNKESKEDRNHSLLREERFNHQVLPVAQKGDIGIPRSHITFEIFVFFETFFNKIGLRYGFSKPTTHKTIRAGEQLAPAGHCLPVKVAIAHCEDLLQNEVQAIFVPQIMMFDMDERKCFLCVYSQQVAAFTKCSLIETHYDKEIPIISPSIWLSTKKKDDSVRELFSVFKEFGIKRKDIEIAFDEALFNYIQWKNKNSVSGISLLLKASKERPVIVLFARPYTIYDPSINTQIIKRFEKLGIEVITCDTLSGTVPNHEEDDSIMWFFGHEQAKAAQAIKTIPHAYPVILTYYGCGVDAFMIKHLQEIWGENKPYLCIELDGHSGEAGLETRIEAFVDQISSGITSYDNFNERDRSKKWIQLNRGKNNGKILVAVPNFAPHSYAFAGIFERLGMKVELLPEPDENIRQLGESNSNGRECNPYFYLLGDLLNWSQKPNVDGYQRAFFLPVSSRSACLISQYGKSFERALKNSGKDNVAVWSPTGTFLMEFFSIEELKHLWMGLLGIDYLFRFSCLIEPYEICKGETKKHFYSSLEQIRKGINTGNIIQSIEESINNLRSVKTATQSYDDRIKIGIIGDVYTRINNFANQGLYEMLESLGCQILPPPFLVDLLLYDMVMDPIRLWKDGNKGKSIIRALLSTYQWAIWQFIRIKFPLNPMIISDGNHVTGPFIPWYRKSSKYLNVKHEGLLAQNLGKAFDHIYHGADGIINVMCHGCMIGTSSEAVMRLISREHNSIPILSLSYDSLGDVHTTTRIEAFIGLVRSYKKRKSGESLKL